MMPPAPMQTTLPRELLLVPGIACPRSSTDVCEAINAGRMVFYSFSVDFDFKVLIHPHETDEAIAAENRHDSYVSRAFQAFLEVFVRPGWVRAVDAFAGWPSNF